MMNQSQNSAKSDITLEATGASSGSKETIAFPIFPDLFIFLSALIANFNQR